MNIHKLLDPTSMLEIYIKKNATTNKRGLSCSLFKILQLPGTFFVLDVVFFFLQHFLLSANRQPIKHTNLFRSSSFFFFSGSSVVVVVVAGAFVAGTGAETSAVGAVVVEPQFCVGLASDSLEPHPPLFLTGLEGSFEAD